MLPQELQSLVAGGPFVHLSTISADGTPQVSVVWAAVDDGELVTAHMRRTQAKLRNIDRDPRVTLSFMAPPEPGIFMAHYAVLKARATIEGPSEDAWELLDRMAKVYVGPDVTFPAPRGPGFIVRYAVEHVGGVGPWVQGAAPS